MTQEFINTTPLDNTTVIQSHTLWAYSQYLEIEENGIPIMTWLNAQLNCDRHFALPSKLHTFMIQHLNKDGFSIQIEVPEHLSPNEIHFLSQQSLLIKNYDFFSDLEKQALTLIRPYLRKIEFEINAPSQKSPTSNTCYSLLKNENHLNNYLLSSIHHHQQKNAINFSDIHIYYDENIDLEETLKLFKQFNIPFRYLNPNQNIPALNLILSKYLSALFPQDDILLLYTLRFSEIGIGKNMCLKWLQQAKDQKLTFYDFLHLKQDKSERQQTLLKDFFSSLEKQTKKDVQTLLDEIFSYLKTDKSCERLSAKLFQKYLKADPQKAYFFIAEYFFWEIKHKDSIKILPLECALKRSQLSFILGGEDLNQANYKSSLNQSLFLEICTQTDLCCTLISTCIRHIKKDTHYTSIAAWCASVSFQRTELEEGLDDLFSTQDFLFYFPKSQKIDSPKISFNAETVEFSYKIGQKVYHQQFGYGVIEKIDANLEDKSLHINFNSNAVILSSKFSTLTVV